jgi:hypothetical protein
VLVISLTSLLNDIYIGRMLVNLKSNIQRQEH